MKSMKNRFSVLVSVALALLLVAQAPAQVTKEGPTYKFRMAWNKGDVYKYNVNIVATMPNGKTVPTSGESTMTVLSVVNGVADVEVESMDPTSKKLKKVNVKMDSFGPVGATPGLGGISDQRLPEKPMKVGETWTTTRTVKQGNRPLEFVSTYTLKGVKNYKGTKCAVFDVVATTKGFVSDSTGTLYLEAKNGQLFQLDIDTKITMGTGLKAQTMTSTTNVSRKK